MYHIYIYIYIYTPLSTFIIVIPLHDGTLHIYYPPPPLPPLFFLHTLTLYTCSSLPPHTHTTHHTAPHCTTTQHAAPHHTTPHHTTPHHTTHHTTRTHTTRTHTTHTSIYIYIYIYIPKFSVSLDYKQIFSGMIISTYWWFLYRLVCGILLL